ncbi:hypothetical protein BDP81DRAFT_85278 [Colletotrichum phormii]|uniref:Uncharacterized protein n=1 Tax=Colletotrichum phormii TaxID=359342 RepID=A0AAJ0A3S9_9PEZI|nr:uncharacterized protein BDP81DRAFT_85278 [Colletotrichum phormii]KAK1654551.1 hypothetical protein BDP81DRAFT_85278 [Colletotrichum phormii]
MSNIAPTPYGEGDHNLSLSVFCPRTETKAESYLPCVQIESLPTPNFYLICPSVSEWNPAAVSRAVSSCVERSGALTQQGMVAWPRRSPVLGVWRPEGRPLTSRSFLNTNGDASLANSVVFGPVSTSIRNQSAAYLAQARWPWPATSHASRLRIYTILASFSNLLQNDMGWPLLFPGTLPPLNLVRHHRRRAPNNRGDSLALLLKRASSLPHNHDFQRSTNRVRDHQ